MLKFLIPLLSLGFGNFLLAQPITIELPSPFSISSVDAGGNIFIADHRGNIYKYDTLGNEQSVYSPVRKSRVALLNAELSMKIWVFYEDIQQMVVLDRMLKPIESKSFGSDETFISLIASDYDNHIWWIDNGDFSLKKQNLLNGEIINATPLNLILNEPNYQFGYMRYYQNKLYISHSGKGLLVFDNFGNLIKEWPLQGIGRFSFYLNEVFYLQNNQLVFMDLLSGAIRQEDLSEGIKWIEISQYTRFEIYSKSIKLYKK